MREQSVFDYLTEKLAEQRTIIIESLTKGELLHYDYVKLCGSLRGLEYAEELIKDLAKRMEEDDE